MRERPLQVLSAGREGSGVEDRERRDEGEEGVGKGRTREKRGSEGEEKRGRWREGKEG